MNISDILDSMDRIVAGFDEEHIKKEYSDEFNNFKKAHSRNRTFDIYVEYIEILQNYLDMRNSKILDLGCGYGISSIILAHYNNDVTGIDFFEPRIKVAKKLASLFNKYSIKIVHGNASKLSFEDSTYDFALLNEFVSHVYDLEGTLDECRRVLKRQGSIIISDCTKLNLTSLKLRYIQLPKYEQTYRKYRKRILMENINTMNLKINDKIVEKIAQKTRGWSKTELKGLVENYSKGEKRLRKLLSLYNPKFPFRDPNTGMYEERLFSPKEMKNILLKQGYSSSYQLPYIVKPYWKFYKKPISFIKMLYEYIKTCYQILTGYLNPKYYIIGVKGEK